MEFSCTDCKYGKELVESLTVPDRCSACETNGLSVRTGFVHRRGIKVVPIQRQRKAEVVRRCYECVCGEKYKLWFVRLPGERLPRGRCSCGKVLKGKCVEGESRWRTLPGACVLSETRWDATRMAAPTWSKICPKCGSADTWVALSYRGVCRTCGYEGGKSGFSYTPENVLAVWDERPGQERK